MVIKIPLPLMNLQEYYLKNSKNKKKVEITFKSVKGADHFYENNKDEFNLIVDEYIKKKLTNT